MKMNTFADRIFPAMFIQNFSDPNTYPTEPVNQEYVTANL